MNRLFRNLLGTKKYSVNCSSPSRICGRLMGQFPEAVFNVSVTGEYSFVFSCLCSVSKKAETFLDSFDCEMKLLGIYGTPLYLNFVRQRPGLLIGLILTVLFAVYRNNTIWDIEVSGNKKIGDSEIINTLSELDFAVGKTYSKEKISSVCNKFIILDDRFTRIAINMSGNVAFAEVTERTKKKTVEPPVSESGILSAYDCIIERPEVFSGTSLVEKGQAVEKGTLLISPVEKGADGNEYISGAKGKIYAKTVERFAVYVPYETRKVIYEKDSCKKHILSFLGTNARIPTFFNNTPERYLCNVTAKKLRLSENIILPFKLKSIEKIPYNTENRLISRDEAEEVAYQKMYRKLSRDLGECEVLSTAYEVKESEKYITLYCTAECIRDVAMGNEQ